MPMSHLSWGCSLAETLLAWPFVYRDINDKQNMSHCFPVPSLDQWDAFICLSNPASSGKQLIGTGWWLQTVNLVLYHMIKADPLQRWRRWQEKSLWENFNQCPSQALSSSILSAPPLPICIGIGCEKAGKGAESLQLFNLWIHLLYLSNHCYLIGTISE